jgi:hypothetical protein
MPHRPGGLPPLPVGAEGELGFLLLTQRDPLGERVGRHRVILAPLRTPDLAEFLPGATLYVEGRLARHGARGRVAVIAERAFSSERLVWVRPTTVRPGSRA